MKESKWSDEELQELLNQMPKIKDTRDPREIYQTIEIKMGKQKKRTWILPAAKRGRRLAPAIHSCPKPYELAGIC